MTTPRALVTGVSSGLGADLARRFAADGWDVLGCGRRPAADADVGDGVTYHQLDVTDPTDRAQLVKHAADEVDLVVHNAAVYPDPTDGRTEGERLELTFQVNAFAPYLLTLELLAARPPGRFCSFVMVNSDAMFHADEGSGLYAASKAALRVLTTAVASRCREHHAAASSLVLGPLADPKKVGELRRVAAARERTEEEVVRLFLRRSNPDLVIDHLIGLDACYESVRHLHALGATANGMVCRLDGGSSGSLV